MKRIVGIFFLLFICQNLAYAQTQGKATVINVPNRKALIFKTLVTDQGKPNAIIVAANTPELRTLAAKVQMAVKNATGTRLEVVDVKKVANLRGEFVGGLPSKNIIVLGNLQNNGLIAHLYFRGYCGVNANYPGPTGYVIQTVCDPWATGANAIVLGGSSLIGIAKATERFCSNLPKGATLSIPRDLKADIQERYKVADLNDADIARTLVQATADFKAGKHNGLFPLIVAAGNNYKLTGKESQAKLFKELLFLEYDLRVNSPNEFDSPWGGGADMQFAPLMMAWDNVEESPSLSDSDRQKVLHIILEYIHFYENYAYIPSFKTATIRHNHHTFPGQGFSAAGRYFSKYYPNYSDGPKWLKMGDDCFRVQQGSWKSMENSSAYMGLAMRHMCYYATTRSDFTWFDSGRADIAGDIAIMTMDNLGSQCAFGDITGYTSVSHFDLWNTLATVERNGRYSWAISKARSVLDPSPVKRDSVPVHVKPVEPTDLLGTKFLIVDPLFYSSLNGSGSSQGKVPQSQTFDKLTFRSSFDPQKQYLAIQGINIGYHTHKDGNSVLRLSDNGRIWLADGDYIKASAKYHNTLLIFRDGEATAMPPFIRRDLVADLPSVGLTRTTMADYGGTDWTRNIIWDKEHAFVFIDEIKANSTESYSVRTLWYTLGDPQIKGNTFNLSQKGEQFSIQNLDGSQLRYTKDVETGKNWETYKYAEPVVNTLQQARTMSLKKDDKIYVINVMSAQSDGKAPIAAVRVNESSLLIGKGRQQALAGLGHVKLSGLETDAQLYWITRERIALAGVRQLKLAGRKLFDAADTISTEVSATGIVLATDEATKITLYNAGNRVLLDGAPVKRVAKSTLTIVLPAGKHKLTGLILPKQFSIQFPPSSTVKAKTDVDLGAKKLVVKAEFMPLKAIDNRPFATGSEGVYVAGSNGVLHALNTDLKSRWTYNVGGDIRAVWTGKLGKNDPERIVAGDVNGRIVVLDQNGKLVWEQLVPLYRLTRRVNYLTAADLTGNGDRALIVGSQNWYNYAYDPTGKMLWSYLCVHGASAGAAFDLDGDGKQEVLSGTEYYTWGAINPDGKVKWVIRGGPGANDVAAADLNGDGKPMVFMAGADGYLYAMDAKGKRPWTYSTGDGATCVLFKDVNGDGKQEVLAGSLSNDLLAISAEGKKLWRRDIGEPILCMAQADMDGDGQTEIIVGTANGNVITLNSSGLPVAHWKAGASVNKLIALSNKRVVAGTNAGKLVILEME